MTFATAGGLDLSRSRNREIFFSTRQNGTKGDHAVFGVAAAGGVARVEFTAPNDLSMVIALELIINPEHTAAAADYDLDSDYGAAGEARTNHSESNTAATYNVTTDQLFAVDLTTVFAALTAGDVCGVKFTNNEAAGAVQLLGVRLRYR
jgi:hypothetical protein